MAQQASFSLSFMPAIFSGWLYLLKLNGLVVPEWLILLPLSYYVVILSILIVAVIVATVDAICEDLKK